MIALATECFNKGEENKNIVSAGKYLARRAEGVGKQVDGLTMKRNYRQEYEQQPDRKQALQYILLFSIYSHCLRAVRKHPRIVYLALTQIDRDECV